MPVKNDLFIYAARDSISGKLVNDITNPSRRFWEKRGTCLSAIKKYNEKAERYPNLNYPYRLEMATFKLIEVLTND